MVLTLHVHIDRRGGWLAHSVAGHALVHACVLASDGLKGDGVSLNGLLATWQVLALPHPGDRGLRVARNLALEGQRTVSLDHLRRSGK